MVRLAYLYSQVYWELHCISCTGTVILPLPLLSWGNLPYIYVARNWSEQLVWYILLVSCLFVCVLVTWGILHVFSRRKTQCQKPARLSRRRRRTLTRSRGIFWREARSYQKSPNIHMWLVNACPTFLVLWSSAAVTACWVTAGMMGYLACQNCSAIPAVSP